MNRNIKTGALMALAASAGLTSCSRYEEGGPSLRSPENRLKGEWNLVDCEKDYIDDLLKEGSIVFEFDKDGDVEVTVNYSYTYYGFTFDYSYSEDGDWEFDNKKTEINIDFGGSDEDFDIIKLKKNELILEDSDGDQWEFEKEN